MSAEKPMNATIRGKQKQAEQRKLMIILLSIVLIIFSIGTIFGCFLCALFAPQEVSAESDIEQTTAVPTTLEFICDNRTLDAELQATMIEMCEKYDIPLALALAVAEQESRFNPDEVSKTNDYGIMQINVANFSWLREQGIEPLDYKGNIEAGILMLSQAVKKHGEYNLALMAYNCGDAGAKRLWKKGIYSTAYSRTTMERYYKWDKYIRGV